MSGVKHTPWEDVETESSVDVEGCTGWQDIADQSGRTVAIVIGWGGWTDRDLDRRVNLIAAAPDHYAVALELDRLGLVIDSAIRFADPAFKDKVQALLRANRAAIARARGEQDGGGHV